MRFNKCALLCAILALSILEPITARKGFSGGGSRHSYPKSHGGLSGGGSHGYPSSGGLSGGGHASGGSHSYPSSGGSHAYPSSGGSHGYPASGGLSGNSGGRGNPSSGGSHSYPSSGGSHGYPGSGGLSGNNNHGSSYPKSPSGTTTNVHHHYHYNPPQQIHYSPTRGAPAVSYPVYQGTPPSYVYKYKDSGSKYGTLIAGLALLNLGTLAAGTAYAVSHSHGSNGGHSSYKAAPGEVCKFGLKKANGDYEETRIECQLISSFILAEEAKTQHGVQQKNTTVTTVTVTNVTMVNNTNPAETVSVNQTATRVLYEMLPNGTLVPVNVPIDNSTTNATSDSSASSNNPMTSSVVTTTTNTTTVTNALDVKGKPVDVTPDMQCFVIRTTPTSNMRKTVPCQLLQTYADKSIQRNSAIRSVPTFALLTAVIAVFVLN